MPTDEEKLLAILAQPERDHASPEDSPEDLTEEQRELLASLLTGALPSPEEIIRDAMTAEHNAEVQRKRDEKKARKLARRQTTGKKRHRSR